MHFTNLPFVSRQGAAIDGAEVARRLSAERARKSFGIPHLPLAIRYVSGPRLGASSKRDVGH